MILTEHKDTKTQRHKEPLARRSQSFRHIVEKLCVFVSLCSIKYLSQVII